MFSGLSFKSLRLPIIVFSFTFMLGPVVQGLEAGLEFQTNVSPEIEAQVIADLAFMGSVEGSKASPLHLKIFGKLSDHTYEDWFHARITSVSGDECTDPMAVACVMVDEDPHQMLVSENYLKFDHPQIARGSILYHEARHSEAEHNFWLHEKCPKNFSDENGDLILSIWSGVPLARARSCDDTALGSYGSQAVMLKNIAAYCTHCNSKLKADAEIFAADDLMRILNTDAKRELNEDFKSL